MQVRAVDTGSMFTGLSTQTFMERQWHHIVGVVKYPKDSVYLFVDGTLWFASHTAFHASATDPTNSTSSMMGADGWGHSDYFYGKLDEARIEDAARSPDWIKLCYMNQKEVDALVK
jgi:hypothetical protein